MYAAHAGTLPATRDQTFLERLNTQWHERALQGFMVIVLAHWAEHLLQAFQIYALGWPVPQALGALGMLAGLWMLRSGFTGENDRKWWTIALSIQFFHHIEHFLLQGQYLLGQNLFGRPVPTLSLIHISEPTRLLSSSYAV